MRVCKTNDALDYLFRVCILSHHRLLFPSFLTNEETMVFEDLYLPSNLSLILLMKYRVRVNHLFLSFSRVWMTRSDWKRDPYFAYFISCFLKPVNSRLSLRHSPSSFRRLRHELSLPLYPSMTIGKQLHPYYTDASPSLSLNIFLILFLSLSLSLSLDNTISWWVNNSHSDSGKHLETQVGDQTWCLWLLRQTAWRPPGNTHLTKEEVDEKNKCSFPWFYRKSTNRLTIQMERHLNKNQKKQNFSLEWKLRTKIKCVVKDVNKKRELVLDWKSGLFPDQ